MEPTVDAATTARPGPWSPLRVSVFRWLWMAGVVSNIGTYMHTLAAGWAVTDLTSSPTVVSLVQTAWTVPGFALALLAGALADVVDRRRLILITQAASIACAAALGILTATGTLTVSALLGLTLLLSTAGTIAAPAFMAVVPELVDRDQLPQAIGLNSISNNLAQSIGPAIAGLVIAASGAGAVFLANAASFVAIMVVVSRWRPEAAPNVPPEHIGAAVRTGLRYVRNSPRLPSLAGRVAVSMMVASALGALLPILVRDELGAGAGAFGLLSTASGLGAIAAVWLLPRLPRSATPDRIVMAAATLWAAGAAIVATAPSLVVAALALSLVGAAMAATMNTVFSMYTVLLPSWVRGRATSVAMLVIWLGASLGALGWGALATATSVRAAILVAAVSQLVITAVATFIVPIGRPDSVDITPVAWNMPELQVPPTPEQGPVLVTVEWHIDPSEAIEFTRAMRPVMRQRRRDGAYNWGLFQDLEQPGRMVELFHVSTWAEHERQHHRSIAADDIEQQPARALLRSPGTSVRHHISATGR